MNKTLPMGPAVDLVGLDVHIVESLLLAQSMGKVCNFSSLSNKKVQGIWEVMYLFQETKPLFLNLTTIAKSKLEFKVNGEDVICGFDKLKCWIPFTLECLPSHGKVREFILFLEKSGNFDENSGKSGFVGECINI